MSAVGSVGGARRVVAAVVGPRTPSRMTASAVRYSTTGTQQPQQRQRPWMKQAIETLGTPFRRLQQFTPSRNKATNRLASSSSASVSSRGSKAGSLALPLPHVEASKTPLATARKENRNEESKSVRAEDQCDGNDPANNLGLKVGAPPTWPPTASTTRTASKSSASYSRRAATPSSARQTSTTPSPPNG